MRGDPPKWNLFIKNHVFILACLNFSHLESTLHLMQTHLPRLFSHCSEQFLNLSILRPFSASTVFVLFCLFHIGKMFPFEDFFIWGKKKESLGVRSGA